MEPDLLLCTEIVTMQSEVRLNETCEELYLRLYMSRVVVDLHNYLCITKVVNSNPVHDEVYSIQHYVINFVSELLQVCGFLQVPRFPKSMK